MAGDLSIKERERAERVAKNAGLKEFEYADTNYARVYIAYGFIDGIWRGMWATMGIANGIIEFTEDATKDNCIVFLLKDAALFQQMCAERGMINEGRIIG